MAQVCSEQIRLFQASCRVTLSRHWNWINVINTLRHYITEDMRMWAARLWIQATQGFCFYDRYEIRSTREMTSNLRENSDRQDGILPLQIYYSLSWQPLAHFSGRLLEWGNPAAWRGSSLQSKIGILLGAGIMLSRSYETAGQPLASWKPDLPPASSPIKTQEKVTILWLISL